MKEDDTEYKINLTGDPVTNFLVKKLNYFTLFVFTVAINFIIYILLGLYYNTIFGAPSVIGKDAKFTPLIKDYNGLIIAILIIVISLFAKNLLDRAEDVFSSLPKKQIFKFKDATAYKEFLDRFQKDSNNKYIFLICLLILPILSVIILPAFLQKPTEIIIWHKKEYFLLSWAHMVTLSYFYNFATYFLAWKIFIIIKSIRLLGEFDYNVQILHPDRCGGFKPIGDLCLNIDMIVFAVSGTLVSLLYFFPLEEQLLALFLLILTVCIGFFFFFYPIMDIHRVMQNRKIEIMNKISMKLQNHHVFYEQTIDKGGNIDTNALKRIQDIREINREISKIPVWPFDSDTLWKFASTTSIPVIAIVLKITGVG